VLEVALAPVFHLSVDTDDDAVEHARGDEGLAGRGQIGHASRQVHTLAIHIVLVDVQVGGVDACAQVQLLCGGQRFIERSEVAVQRHGRLHGLGGLVEFGQETIAQALHQTAMTGRQDLRGGVVHEAAPLVDDGRFVGGHEANRLDQVEHQHHLVPLLRQRRDGRRVALHGRGRRWCRLGARSHAWRGMCIWLQFLTCGRRGRQRPP
jgi:hypothetical protein